MKTNNNDPIAEINRLTKIIDMTHHEGWGLLVEDLKHRNESILQSLTTNRNIEQIRDLQQQHRIYLALIHTRELCLEEKNLLTQRLQTIKKYNDEQIN